MQPIGYLQSRGASPVTNPVSHAYEFRPVFIDGTTGDYNLYLRCHGILSSMPVGQVHLVNARYPSWSPLVNSTPFWVLSFLGLVLILPLFWFNAASTTAKLNDSDFSLTSLRQFSLHAFYGTVMCIAVGASYVYISKGPGRDSFTAIGYTTVDGLFRSFTGSRLEEIFPVSAAVFDTNPANRYNNNLLAFMLFILSVIAALFLWNFIRWSVLYFRRQWFEAEQLELSSFAGYLWELRREHRVPLNSAQFVATSFAMVPYQLWFMRSSAVPRRTYCWVLLIDCGAYWC
jgi:hypothetical protein